MRPNRYNVRVYGIWINDHQEVLLTDERRNRYDMTKFPGGGHEFGEGLAEGLKREWREELDLEIEVGELFYINDFAQVSRFNPRDQLLSVYYRITADPAAEIPLTAVPLDFPAEADNAQSFRWCAIRELDPEMLTFPVDRVVAHRLKAEL
ncbi:MAG: NUDIX domain-containing protein [Bacteroidota bacterium]